MMYKGSCVCPGIVLALCLGLARCRLAVSSRDLEDMRYSSGEDRLVEDEFQMIEA